MINPDICLSQKIFSKDVETKAIRDGFGDGLVEAGDRNENVVALSGDLKDSTRVKAFSEKFPNRYFECGVAEQNLAGIAAGLGISGKIPFISSFAVFSPGRNWEQIRTAVAYNDSNVKIAGHHCGISVGKDGATHQATEDIALMRVLPNMKVFVPCDYVEAKKAVVSAVDIWGPVYIRLSRNKSPVITTEKTPFIPGKANVLWKSPSPKVLIIGSGYLLYNSLLAAKELEKEKIGTIVLNSHTIKPLDEKQIISLSKKCGAVVTVEDHQMAGGLGGAIAELLSKNTPVPMEFIGLRDSFGESGPAGELIAKYEMDVESIKKAVRKALKRKK